MSAASGCRRLLLSLAALAPAASLELLPRDVFSPADAAAFIAEFSAAPPPRAPAPSNGTYVIDVSARAQTLWGIGFEIQSDSIGSGNHGLPDSNASVPWDLVPAERARFARDVLAGFRYCRLGLGLYFRGTTPDGLNTVERWPGQAAALADMARASGIEGFAPEYWSPPPGWKSNGAFIGGTLRAFDGATLAAFGDAVVRDLRYLNASGLVPVMWGLQNEPPYSTPYSCCVYNESSYAAAFAATARAVRAAFPEVLVHVCSNTGQGAGAGALVAADARLSALVDAWTWHCVGCASTRQLGDAGRAYARGAQGKFVLNNEFEYLDDKTSTSRCVNTAQSIMNWFTFAGAPSWFWLHASKPTTNAESEGYGLSFWRPYNDTDFSPTHFPDLPAGHFTPIDDNLNAVAGFTKYLPWDSVRVNVTEMTGVLPGQRILAYLFAPAAALWRRGVHGRAHYRGPRAGRDAAARAAATHLGFAVTNEGNATAFTYHVVVEGAAAGAPAPAFEGAAFSGFARDAPLGTKVAARDAWGHWAVDVEVPPLTVQFWVQVVA